MTEENQPEKHKVFQGTMEECLEYLKRNSNNVLLEGMELTQGGTVVIAHRRNDTRQQKG